MRFPVLIAVVASFLPGCSQSQRTERDDSRIAVLGIEARAATAAEKDALKLGDPLAGRVNGVVISKVHADGPAAGAGVATGDVLLALDDNRIYSSDDMLDFVRVAAPGQRVKALLRRASTKTDESVEIALGSSPAPDPAGIAWRFAGPAQLDEALATARSEGRTLLVGVSGAET